MPIYEFCCENCENKFEVLFRSSQDGREIICPKCGSKNTKKLISLFGMTNSKGENISSSSSSSGCSSCTSKNCSSCR